MQFLCVIQNYGIIYDLIMNCFPAPNRCRGKRLPQMTKFSTPEFKTEFVPMHRSNRYLSYWVVVDQRFLIKITLRIMPTVTIRLYTIFDCQIGTVCLEFSIYTRSIAFPRKLRGNRT